MTNSIHSALFRLRPLIAGLSLALAAGGALAAEEAEHTGPTEPVAEPVDEPSGALSYFGLNVNDNAFSKKTGINLGGWSQVGVTYNATAPNNNFNGPVTFGDRSGEVQLNQLYLFLQKAVATEGDNWSFGGRFDFMFGTDSIFTQAYGVPTFDVNTGQPLRRSTWDLNFLHNRTRFYDIALPQLYLEAYVPIGNGLNVKAGHFYTPIGYEVVTAPDNFFYSKPYTFQYGEPFTHTGVMANYSFDQNWSTIAGVLTGSATGGWDGGWDQQLGNWNGLLGGTWTSDDKATSLNVTGTYGGTSEHSSQGWGIYSIVGKHNLMESLHLVVQHDHGFANGVLLGNGTHKDAQWYGVNTYLMYDILDNLGVGVRGEWFRDQDGFRVCSPGRVAAATNVDGSGNTYNFAYSTAATPALPTCSPASWYAFTVGMNYKPLKWLNLRPNIRYDWVDGTQFSGDRYKPFGNGADAQFLFSTDVVITF